MEQAICITTRYNGYAEFRPFGLFCAGLAEAADFHRHLLRGERVIIAPMGQALADMRIRELLHEPAILADREGGHVVLMVRMLAGNVGVEALKPVGQALLDQLVEGAVDGRRRDGSLGAHLVEDLIGGERILGGA